jgi:hypothetical protein
LSRRSKRRISATGKSSLWTIRGSIDSGLSDKRKSEHFSLGNHALVGDAGKLADAKRSVTVNDRAFRAHAA